MKSNCLTCSKKFEWFASQKRKYCSLKCHRAKYKESFVCIQCGKEKETTKGYKSTKRFCSMDCWNIHKRKHFGYKCKQCGNTFVGSGGHSNNYCSQSCYWKSLTIDEETFRKNRNEYTRKYRKENASWTRAQKQKRRSIERNAAGHFTGDEWDTIVSKQNGKCAICFEAKKLTIDHITPLSKGGTNYANNIQGLCISCNSRKWAKI